MDYAELVKELRGFSSWEIEPHKAIMKKSADAIEQLTAELEYTKRQYDLAVEDLEKIGWGEWIPVTERLPEYGTTVLVCGSQGGVYTARYERARAEWGRDSWWKLNSKSHYCNPSHWMPLPTPPKEGTE